MGKMAYHSLHSYVFENQLPWAGDREIFELNFRNILRISDVYFRVMTNKTRSRTEVVAEFFLPSGAAAQRGPWPPHA
jgi:hypothetical protein